ncbi:mitochondrial carrier domain-containing protein [Triangularia verruculosa]|uniref:Mitochondrial carrier domain-containing protein n=1 Tax=Triangularia verruculosa TaxID=2587418 RepID=A0AAN7B0Z7_9PEZI|nr:mitochondrial carrier domain-containing protein [Triangularia verruculosa]
MPRASKLLPSLGHASSGAAGTVISTLLTYPLDLVNTRLKVQRQLRLDDSISEEESYRSIFDAFAKIYDKEGGLHAFFAGLGADVLKSAADSFLFFLFYTWFRARRLVGRHPDLPYLRVIEELAVGAAAGACAKLFTTPVSNVVTRRQTASLLDHSPSSSPARKPHQKGFWEVLREIQAEKGGVLGLWAGYSASLVLTLNPSLTFFLQAILKRLLVDRKKWDDPGSGITFLLAAMSKVGATAVTYPFQIGKARLQMGHKSSKGEGGKEKKGGIFTTVARIRREEGVGALYDGIGGELLKGFFNHGTTMLTKDVVHGVIIKLYWIVAGFLVQWPGLRRKLVENMRKRNEKGGWQLVGRGVLADLVKGGRIGASMMQS